MSDRDEDQSSEDSSMNWDTRGPTVELGHQGRVLALLRRFCLLSPVLPLADGVGGLSLSEQTVLESKETQLEESAQVATESQAWSSDRWSWKLQCLADRAWVTSPSEGSSGGRVRCPGELRTRVAMTVA